jgi:hypothetical protein
VTFTVLPKAGLTTGAQISNAASIVFDKNPLINTPTYTNTVDATTPTSLVKSAKPRRRICNNLSVAYAGSDAGAGIAFLDVFASRNGGPFALWRGGTRSVSDVYSAKTGNYAFYSAATDGVGHPEPNRKAPDLKVKISCKGKLCSVTSTSGFWDIIVASATQRGRALTLRLRRVGLTSVKVLVNGRAKLTRRGRVPTTIRLSRLPKGDYTVSVVGQTAQGTLTVDRVVSGCRQAVAKKRKH